MTQGIYRVVSNTQLTSTVYRMVVEGDVSALYRPGQFVNFKIDGLYLRRPISVCDYDTKQNTITLIYKVVGVGTEKLALAKEGDQFDLLCGLGNGYDVSTAGDVPVLIGGGVGIPPLYGLCRKLIAEGKQVKVILGFNTKDEIFYENEFKDLGAEVYVTTVDGSYGTKGYVTNVLADLDYTYFYTCGPMPMFKAVNAASVTSGQFSFEERMGCGFGACMGCSCKTKYGNKRICKDGPVLVKEEIVW